MKVGTTELVKFRHLKRSLGLPHFATVGLLESLWMFASKNSPQGDIGKHSNEDIACMIEWDGDPDELIDSFVKYQWLDAHAEYRLVIHDWSDHAPNWLKGNLASHGKHFANASLQPAKQRAQSTSQVATKPSPLNSRQSSPPPSNEEPSKPEAVGEADQWEEVEEGLVSSGVSHWRGLLGSFRQTGCSAEHALELIEFWKQHKDRFDSPVGALHHRFENAHPSIPANERWPGLQIKPKPKPAPEVEIGRYTADWSLLRPSRRAKLARQAQIDLSGHEGKGLRELPPALQKPIIEILARGTERKPSPERED